MDSKAAELERMLSQLSDVNDRMKGTLAGRSDTRSHTLTRHRDILHDYQQASKFAAFALWQSVCPFAGPQARKHTMMQEFRRHNSSLIASRDRVQLLRGSSEKSSLLGSQGHTSSGALLRERGQISGANSAVSQCTSRPSSLLPKTTVPDMTQRLACTVQLDEVMGTATAISGRVSEQSQLFENIGNKVLAVGAKFPAINGVINAVRRKKSKVCPSLKMQHALSCALLE